MATYKNPETGKEWTSGKPGKIPNFVKALIAAGAEDFERSTPTSHKKEVVVEDPNTLRFWKWNDIDGKICVPCIVAARTDIEAMKLLNRTFKNFVSPTEFAVAWKMIPATDVVNLGNVPGVFEMNKEKTGWVQRPVINKAIL